MNTKNLINMFTAREIQYQKGTEKILKAVPNFIEAASETIELEPSEKVTWRETQLSDRGIISIIGVVSYNVGETLMTEMGETIIVTEDNQDSLVRIIRVGAPVDLIAEGTVEEIVEFLKEAQNHNLQNQQQAESIVDMLNGIINVEEEGIDGIAMIAEDEEFDIDALSDEQLDSMIINEEASKGKIH